MRSVVLRVEAAPLAPAAAHALDAACADEVAASGQGIVRVYALAGEVLSLGRWHRLPVGAAGVALHRRRTGGRAAASGAGFLHVALCLPHRSALVSDDPAALAPEQVLNRCVRPLLGALDALGVPASYPGRDLVVAQGRPLAVLGLEVDGRGVTLVDAIVSADADQSRLPRWLDRADPDGRVPAAMVLPGNVTSIATEGGRVPDAAALADVLTAAFGARLGVPCARVPALAPVSTHAGEPAGSDGDVAAVARTAAQVERDWLGVRRARAAGERHASVASMLGTLELDVALAADGTIAGIQLTGDFFAPSAAVERLEATLRGVRPDAGAVHDTLARELGPPDFLLGVRPLRTLADAIVACATERRDACAT